MREAVEARDAAAEEQLLAAINAAREGGVGVLAAGGAPPAQLGLREDLRTRLAWGLVYHLKPLSDAEKKLYPQGEAARRGPGPSDPVAGHLLTRPPRALGSLPPILEVLYRC